MGGNRMKRKMVKEFYRKASRKHKKAPEKPKKAPSEIVKGLYPEKVMV